MSADGLIYSADRQEKNGKKKAFLCVSMVGNLALLGVFKYLGFFTQTVNSVFHLSIPVFSLALPVGISFYTFQTMSYSLDVYRGTITPQKNFIYFGAYVAMFPQLIAGPVVRYSDIARELDCRTENLNGFASGARKLICGLAKKVLIANTMAAVADPLFENPASSLGVLGTWIAIIAYTFQIFFDFSGYSDMAIGMGRMMGFNYPENFNYPYISRSVTEFWRRWHITMSTFFRDYVYIPLGGSRCSVIKWLRNVFIGMVSHGTLARCRMALRRMGTLFRSASRRREISSSEAAREIPRHIAHLCDAHDHMRMGDLPLRQRFRCALLYRLDVRRVRALRQRHGSVPRAPSAVRRKHRILCHADLRGALLRADHTVAEKQA